LLPRESVTFSVTVPNLSLKSFALPFGRLWYEEVTDAIPAFYDPISKPDLVALRSCCYGAAGAIRSDRKEIVMNNEATYQQSATQPDPRVQLAFERTFLAYERTRIAWVRTALALISFGFAIAKVLQYMREKQGETATFMSPRAVGLIMIVIGLISLILANRQERRAIKALRERCPGLPPPIAGVMTVLIALLGILALIGAILR
jgi:putative membrane protein